MFCFDLEDLNFILLPTIFCISLLGINDQVISSPRLRILLREWLLRDRVHIKNRSVRSLNREQDHLRPVQHVAQVELLRKVQVLEVLVRHVGVLAVGGILPHLLLLLLEATNIDI